MPHFMCVWRVEAGDSVLSQSLGSVDLTPLARKKRLEPRSPSADGAPPHTLPSSVTLQAVPVKAQMWIARKSCKLD